ncbi:hypothetical protein DDF62_21920 [Caulobacter radicis]|uniref:hypothetical protein n=1 Tax=Caulobacter radicis TaxID=2172650 RepID=UPI000D569DD2|nr:hypothetical protein [Caulobacter radicis]PVM84766.1 hypothetical protein DDF62_21920 [Caulobacter radicis]
MSAVVALAMLASTFSAPLNLPPSARVEVTVEQSSQEPRIMLENDGGQGYDQTSSSARYESLIERQGEGYRVTRTLLERRPPDGTSRLQAVTDAPPRLVYAADRDLKPLRIEEWSRFVSDMRAALKGAVRSDMDRQYVAMATSALSKMPPEDAAHGFLEAEMELAAPINAVFVGGAPVTSQEVFPSASGQDVKIPVVLTLERVDEARGVAVLRRVQTFDAKAMDALLAQVQDVVKERLGPTLTTPEEVKVKVESSETCLYEIGLKTGLPTRAECEHKTVTTPPAPHEPTTRTDRWVITQILKN